jgi:hypothetical protein
MYHLAKISVSNLHRRQQFFCTKRLSSGSALFSHPSGVSLSEEKCSWHPSSRGSGGTGHIIQMACIKSCISKVVYKHKVVYKQLGVVYKQLV